MTPALRQYRITIPDRNKHDILMDDKFMTDVLDLAAKRVLNKLTYCYYWRASRVHQAGDKRTHRTIYQLEFSGTDNHAGLCEEVAKFIRSACNLDKIYVKTFEVKHSDWIS